MLLLIIIVLSVFSIGLAIWLAYDLWKTRTFSIADRLATLAILIAIIAIFSSALFSDSSPITPEIPTDAPAPKLPTNTSVPTQIDTHTPMPTNTPTLTIIPTNTSVPTPIIFEARISDINDDAEERVVSGEMKPGSGDLELTNDSELANAAELGGEQLIGLRFQNVNVPNGAIIQKAFIEFTTAEAGTQDTSLTIFGHAHDNSPTFGKDAKNISQRLDSSATASVSWSDVAPWNIEGEKHQTPDLALIVQEIVGRDGWQSGNAMAFIITGTPKSSRIAEAYDTNEEKHIAPLLHVEYTTP